MTPTTRAFHFCVTTPAMAVAGLVLAVFTLIAVPFGWLEDYLDNRKQRKQVPEIPPAEERPYIPAQISLTLVKHKTQMVTADRPLPNEHWKGKTIERICWELSEGVERG